MCTIGVATLLAGCGSQGTQPAVTVTATAPPTGAPTSAAPKPVAPTATAAKLQGLPAAPVGATQLQTSNSGGVQYARYSTSEQPDQIVSYYTSQWQQEGYRMQNGGGGGGGWGKYGGSDAGATGSKTGSYVDVQAGGSTQGPTYFEICQGPNAQAVDNCGNSSNSGSS